jgi:hypothetical protein
MLPATADRQQHPQGQSGRDRGCAPHRLDQVAAPRPPAARVHEERLLEGRQGPGSRSHTGLGGVAREQGSSRNWCPVGALAHMEMADPLAPYLPFLQGVR